MEFGVGGIHDFKCDVYVRDDDLFEGKTFAIVRGKQQFETSSRSLVNSTINGNKWALILRRQSPFKVGSNRRHR